MWRRTESEKGDGRKSEGDGNERLVDASFDSDVRLK